jgi:shikimate kinase
MSSARRNCGSIVLIGYRGAGKSAVGREVARRLGWEFIDTDAEIERRCGKCIADIFAQEGEQYFRQIEQTVVAEATRAVRRVLSVGGGAVLSEQNRTALRAAGVCVWLTAPAEELHRRLAADPRSASTRPALTDRAGLDEVRHLLAQREPLYAGLAEHVVPTTGRSSAEVADAILALLAGRLAD